MGAVFCIFIGLIHWWPLFTGFSLNKDLLFAHFWIMFLGVNLTFFPQHFLGLGGMPRRYLDYPDSYYLWKVVSSFGSLVSLTGVIFFRFILLESLYTERYVVGVGGLRVKGE